MRNNNSTLFTIPLLRYYGNESYGVISVIFRNLSVSKAYVLYLLFPLTILNFHFLKNC